METYLTRFQDALSKHVRLGCFPVAVRMVKPGEPLPEMVKRPAQDLQIKVATCQAIALARRYGWVVALGEEDISCPLTAVVFGFRQPSEFYIKADLIQTAGDRDPVDFLPLLLRIVVNKGHWQGMQLGIAAHLAYNHGPCIACANHDHPTFACQSIGLLADLTAFGQQTHRHPQAARAE